MHRPIQKSTRKKYLIESLIGLFFGHRLTSDKEDVKKSAETEAQAFYLRANRMNVLSLERMHPGNRLQDGILQKRTCAGRGPTLRRSRSKYNPVEEDFKHGLIDELPAHIA